MVLFCEGSGWLHPLPLRQERNDVFQATSFVWWIEFSKLRHISDTLFKKKQLKHCHKMFKHTDNIALAQTFCPAKLLLSTRRTTSTHNLPSRTIATVLWEKKHNRCRGKQNCSQIISTEVEKTKWILPLHYIFNMEYGMLKNVNNEWRVEKSKILKRGEPL
jgi:hypothetical protein